MTGPVKSPVTYPDVTAYRAPFFVLYDLVAVTHKFHVALLYALDIIFCIKMLISELLIRLAFPDLFKALGIGIAEDDLVIEIFHAHRSFAV